MACGWSYLTCACGWSYLTCACGWSDLTCACGWSDLTCICACGLSYLTCACGWSYLTCACGWSYLTCACGWSYLTCACGWSYLTCACGWSYLTCACGWSYLTCACGWSYLTCACGWSYVLRFATSFIDKSATKAPRARACVLIYLLNREKMYSCAYSEDQHCQAIGNNIEEIAGTSGSCHGDLTHGRSALALTYAKMMQTAVHVGGATYLAHGWIYLTCICGWSYARGGASNFTMVRPLEMMDNYVAKL